MAFLPAGVFDQLALALIVGGTALVVLKRDVPKAYGLAVVILAVYALDVVAGMFRQAPTGVELGFVARDFFRGDAWWTPLMSMFVHADLFHAFGNMFILLTAGPALEHRTGSRRFLLIYFVAGVFALVVHVILAYATDLVSPLSLALGASGAIFGVLSAFAVRYPRERLPMLFGFFVIWLPAFFVLLLYLAFNLAYLAAHAFGAPQGIAWWGHFAGFLVGLAWAPRLPEAPHDLRGVAKGLPDPEKLMPLATTPETKRILERIRQFTPETRTLDDTAYAEAWLDKFFASARCPECQAGFTRKGLEAVCESGETRVDFERAK